MLEKNPLRPFIKGIIVAWLLLPLSLYLDSRLTVLIAGILAVLTLRGSCFYLPRTFRYRGEEVVECNASAGISRHPDAYRLLLFPKRLEIVRWTSESIPYRDIDAVRFEAPLPDTSKDLFRFQCYVFHLAVHGKEERRFVFSNRTTLDRFVAVLKERGVTVTFPG